MPAIPTFDEMAQQSSISDQAKPCIKHANSAKKGSVEKPNLYRANTVKDWGMSTIDNLEEEMKREISALNKKTLMLQINGNPISPISPITPNTSITREEKDEVDGSGCNDIGKGINNKMIYRPLPQRRSTNLILIPRLDSRSNLVQSVSCDWNRNDIDLEENEMKKHMLYLQRPTSGSSSASESCKSNLYRADTTTPWDLSDIEDLNDEMNQQLESLKKLNLEFED